MSSDTLTNYNSSTGSYSDYMKRLSTQIEASTEKQIIYNAAAAATAAVHVTEHIDRASLQIQKGIVLNTQAVCALGKTMIASTNVLNSTMESGFASISSELGNMSAAFSAGLDRLSKSIDRMNEQVCSKLDEIHDIVNNPLLTASRELYRRAVANYKKGFFEEALEDILQAVEKNKTDYISWYLAGKIYLFGVGEFSNVIDSKKAEDAFFNVTKYINPDIGQSTDATMLAAEAYYYLAYSRYILACENKDNQEENKNYLESSNQASTKSFGLSSGMLDSLFNSAKCNVLLGNKDKCMELCEKLILADRNYVFKIVGDSDFESCLDDIVNLIEKLRQQIKNEAKELYSKVSYYSENFEFYGGKYSDIVESRLKQCLAIAEINDDSPYMDMRIILDCMPDVDKFLKVPEFPCDRLVCEEEIDDYNKDLYYLYINEKDEEDNGEGYYHFYGLAQNPINGILLTKDYTSDSENLKTSLKLVKQIDNEKLRLSEYFIGYSFERETPTSGKIVQVITNIEHKKDYDSFPSECGDYCVLPDVNDDSKIKRVYEKKSPKGFYKFKVGEIIYPECKYSQQSCYIISSYSLVNSDNTYSFEFEKQYGHDYYFSYLESDVLMQIIRGTRKGKRIKIRVYQPGIYHKNKIKALEEKIQEEVKKETEQRIEIEKQKLQDEVELARVFLELVKQHIKWGLEIEGEHAFIDVRRHQNLKKYYYKGLKLSDGAGAETLLSVTKVYSYLKSKENNDEEIATILSKYDYLKNKYKRDKHIKKVIKVIAIIAIISGIIGCVIKGW